MSIELLQVLDTDLKKSVFVESLRIAQTHFEQRLKRVKKYGMGGAKEYIGKDNQTATERNKYKLQTFLKMQALIFWELKQARTQIQLLEILHNDITICILVESLQVAKAHFAAKVKRIDGTKYKGKDNQTAHQRNSQKLAVAKEFYNAVWCESF